jgi:adenosylcobinamide kinase/adenosylcobinamide-phosphate guanylyltransferase
MKALFIGGIKSGKSINAQKYTLKHSVIKPFYLATTEFIDEEMQKRIDLHKKSREDDFVTVEEGLKLCKVISKFDDIVLIECISMWINNMIYHNYSDEDILNEINKILELKNDMVFVINDVGNSVISENRLVRRFVDINGIVSQIIASKCDEVYHNLAGISTKIK